MNNKIILWAGLQILSISIILFLTYSISLATGGGPECWTALGSYQGGACTVGDNCNCSGYRILVITHTPAGTCPSNQSCVQVGTGNGILTITETCSGNCSREGRITCGGESGCTAGAPLTSTSGNYPIYGCQ